MSASIRKRKFKRDLEEGPNLPAEIRKKISWLGKAGESHLIDSNYSNWSSLEAYDALRSDVSFERRSWEPLPGKRGAQKDNDINEDFNGASETMRAWDAGNSYSIRTSPDFDGRGRRSHRLSPECSRRRSYRARSRSQSRSHSPVCDSKWESYGWSDRRRPGSEAFPHPCKDFIIGRCRRGNQCRFVHQENLKNRDEGHSNIDLAESWENREEYRGASRYARIEGYRNDPRYEGSHGYENLYDGERNESRRKSSRSTKHCNDFRKGEFYRGLSRRYVHHHASGDGYDRGNGDAVFDHDHKTVLHRSGDALCKYFAMGNCRNGDYCRFSHDGPAHRNLERRSQDDKWDHDLDDENSNLDAPFDHDPKNVLHGRGAALCKYFVMGKCRKGDYCRFSHDGPAHRQTDRTSGDDRWDHDLNDENNSWGSSKWKDTDIAKSTGWGDGDVSDMAAENSAYNRWGHSLNNGNRSSGSPVRKDTADERDKHQSFCWGTGSSAANRGISESEVATKLSVKEEHLFVPRGSQSQTLNGISRPDREQNITQETSGLQLDATVVHPTVSENSCVQRHFSKRRHKNARTASSNSHNDGPVDGYGRSNGDAPFDHDRKHVLRRSDDTLCKYFAMGKCRNGDYCWSSHEVPAHRNPKGRSQDDRWVHDMDDENNSWSGRKWNDTAAVSDVTKSTVWGDSSVGKMKFTDSVAAENSSYYRGAQRLDNENRSPGGPVRKDKADERDEHQSSCWGSGSSAANMDIAESVVVTKLSVKAEPPFVLQGSQSQTLNGISIPDRELNQAQETSGLQLAATVVHSTVSESSSVQQHLGKSGNNNPIIASSNSHDDINLSANIAHAVPVPRQCFKQDGDILGSQALSSLDETCADETSQNQQMLSLNSSSGHNFDLNRPLQLITSPSNLQSQIQFCQGESIETPAMGESKVLRVTAETPQNEVTSEQVTQITKLSVSLAQGFGNELQLPRQNSALNPLSSTESVPSLPNSASLSSPADSKAVHLNPATLSQEQYDSVGDSIDFSKPGSSNQPLSLLPNPIEQKNQIPLGLNSSEVNHRVSSEEEDLESSKFKRRVPIANTETKENSRTFSGECKLEPKTGHSENVDVDGSIEEGNKNKDEKEMLIFKIALAEFVKDILQPLWKEGRVSKEVYKTIVKKVVDKVMGTIPPVHIPKTREKIDHYLTYSKSKITKLVQAYVEIYPKVQESDA